MDIENEPIEYQARYWKVRALAAEDREAALKRKKTPPERTELEKLQTDHKILEIRYEHLEHSIHGFVRLRDDLLAQIESLKGGTRIPQLEQERDNWRQQWRSCARRLADKIEHLGLEHSSIEPNKDEP